MYTSIMVCVDGSDHAAAALKVALDLAAANEATLRVLNVPTWPRADDALGVAAGAPSLEVSREDVLQKGLDLIASMLSELHQENAENIVPLTVLGDPAEVILEQARHHHVDAIVMGSRGMGNLERLVMGSVSHKVLHASECTAIIVRA